MVSASGPTGILAGRPSGSQCLQGSQSSQNGCATRNHNEKNIETEENAKQRHESDLYIRPSWTDAAIALDQLEKVSFLFNETIFSSCYRIIIFIFDVTYS